MITEHANETRHVRLLHISLCAAQVVRDDFHRTLERINRWRRAWDRACRKPVRALFVTRGAR